MRRRNETKVYIEDGEQLVQEGGGGPGKRAENPSVAVDIDPVGFQETPSKSCLNTSRVILSPFSAMFEPHLQGTHLGASHSEGVSLLDELDKIAPIKSFDAFPKVRRSPLNAEVGSIDLRVKVTPGRGSHSGSGLDHFSAGLGKLSLMSNLRRERPRGVSLWRAGLCLSGRP
jgi:hypothetical protein